MQIAHAPLQVSKVSFKSTPAPCEKAQASEEKIDMQAVRSSRQRSELRSSCAELIIGDCKDTIIDRKTAMILNVISYLISARSSRRADVDPTTYELRGDI